MGNQGKGLNDPKYKPLNNGEGFSFNEHPAKVKTWLAKRSDPRCLTCADHPRVHGALAVRQHLLIPHTIFLRPRSRDIRDNPDAMTKEYTETVTWWTSGLPWPVYHTDDGRYHIDPIEYSRYLEALYDRVIAGVDVEKYGVRLEIEIPDGMLSEDCNGHDPDRKYDVVRLGFGGGSHVIRDGFCMLCASDPQLDWATRMSPFNGKRHPRHHMVLCFKGRYKELRSLLVLKTSGKPLPIRSDYLMAANGWIRCPDPVCADSHRSFSTLFTWFLHLVCVHSFQLFGRARPALGRHDLAAIAFSDADSLDQWVDGKSKTPGVSDKVGKVGTKKLSSNDRRQVGKKMRTAVPPVVEDDTADDDQTDDNDQSAAVDSVQADTTDAQPDTGDMDLDP